ncbi:MAG: minichromosome maintenance protein MCM [Nanoarchaeota archaeon]|nr:minichromosome maintenance protein MCM [Nanoarchaeota archaeon]MBU4124463.1 minichromosome maintenance protein MCM [Nanoarchaeota archaeon]
MEMEKFEEFFRQFYEKDLMAAAALGEKSILVDFSLLDKFDPILADKLLNDPDEIIEQARLAIRNIDLPEGSIKIEPRFLNFPQQQNIRIRNLRSEHIGKFMSIDGIVRLASEVLPQIECGVYECMDCGYKTEVKPTDKMLAPPMSCDKCNRRGRFDLVSKKLYDFRMIKIEEPFEIASGEKSCQLRVFLKEDLTSPELQRKHDPGNRLRINGILREQKRITKGKMSTTLELFLDANNIEATEIEWDEVDVNDADVKKIKELSVDPLVFRKIVNSIAPSIYGLDRIKEAIALQMFSGVPHVLNDGVRIRGDIHVLLLGDPSTAKSQILKLISKVMPRGKYVSGKGSSAAGLTATVVKDEELTGGWILEAGAMVLANKSLISIDEFDKIAKEDMVALHEAMSIQTISIAKASIIATLPAQVSVLAGANPKLSRFDKFKPVSQQTDIPETILSRFDLKFVLKDIPDKDMDRRLADHIVSTRLNPETTVPELGSGFIRKYVAYARKYCKPEMTKESANKMAQFYVDMRAKSTPDSLAITLRQNEALMRLAEASAKIRLSPTVEVQDADRAISIMEYSINELGYDAETGKIDIDRMNEKTSSTQRAKIHTILDIIEMLGKKIGIPTPREEIIAAAEDRGISTKDVEELLFRLKKEGFTFEPKPNFIQKI